MDRSTRSNRLRCVAATARLTVWALAASIIGGSVDPAAASMLSTSAVLNAAAAVTGNSGPNGGAPGVHTGGSRTETGAQVTVGQEVIPSSGRTNHRGAGRRSIACRFAVVDGMAAYGPEVSSPEAGQTLWRSCFDTASGDRVSGPTIVTIGPGSATRPVVTAALVDLALANIDIALPQPSMSPPGATLPNLDTWMWIDDHPDERASASAAGVTITVIAELRGVGFEIGSAAADNHGRRIATRDDEVTVRCAGSGRPFPTDPYQPSVVGACRHRFAAPTRNLNIDATATWHIGWTATNGTSGDLGTVTRTTSVRYRVQEKRTVIRR